MTEADFAKLRRASRREPLSHRCTAATTIVGLPPPSSGGVHVARDSQHPRDLRPQVRSPAPGERQHVMAEAMKLAFADRAYWLGDPDFRRTSRAGSRTKTTRANSPRASSLDHAPSPCPSHGTPPDVETNASLKNTPRIFPPPTPRGTGSPAPQTINTSFGSKVIVPGTGILLNDEMDDFSDRARRGRMPSSSSAPRRMRSRQASVHCPRA